MGQPQFDSIFTCGETKESTAVMKVESERVIINSHFFKVYFGFHIRLLLQSQVLCVSFLQMLHVSKLAFKEAGESNRGSLPREQSLIERNDICRGERMFSVGK